MKRILALLAVLALVLALMACAGCGDKTTSSAGSGNADAQASEEEYFMDMPSELKGTTVKFATWIDHAQTDTKICLAGFEQTTGMKYEMVSVNQSDYIVKLAALIAADQAPDVVVDNSEFPRTLNLLQPLTLEDNGLDPTDPFWNQSLTKTFTIGKYCYLVNGARSSWDMAGANVYYNKTKLEEAGLATPKDLYEQDNWNLETFAKLIKDSKTACGLEKRSTVIDVNAFAAMYGTTVVKWDPATGTFSSGAKDPNMLKAMQWLLKMTGEGLVENMLGSAHSSLENGTGVLQLAGAYGLRNKPGWFYTMDKDDLGYACLPKLEAGDEKYPFTASTRAYGICKGARNPKGAAYFLRYFLNEDHYDVDQIFKDEEAKNLYFMLRENQNPEVYNFANGVNKVLYPDTNDLTGGVMKDVAWTSLDQVSVKLSSVDSLVQGSCDKANQLIADIIANQ